VKSSHCAERVEFELKYLLKGITKSKLQTNSLAWIILRERKAEWMIVRFIPLVLKPQKGCIRFCIHTLDSTGYVTSGQSCTKEYPPSAKVIERSIVIRQAEDSHSEDNTKKTED